MDGTPTRFWVVTDLLGYFLAARMKLSSLSLMLLGNFISIAWLTVNLLNREKRHETLVIECVQ